MTASYNSTIQKGTVVEERTATLIIPRQRGSLSSRLEAPYGGASYALGGGKLIGSDRNSSIIKSNGITDCIAKTENYGEAIVGQWWNGNNTLGDTDLRTTSATLVKDMGFDGSALLRATSYNYLDRKIDPTLPARGQYAWEYTHGNASAPHAPDLHGPDFVRIADGLCMQGAGNHVKQCRFFQIPGYSLVIKQGTGNQAGVAGIFDDYGSFVEHVIIQQGMHGLLLEAGDSKLHDIYIAGVMGDGITMNGSGSFIHSVHIAGADRAFVWLSAGDGANLYCEAARIGTHILASQVHIRGLNIGPGTCYYRGIKVEADACKIQDFYGTVRAEDSTWTDIAGLEIAANTVHHHLQGELVTLGNSDGAIIRGHRGYLDLQGGIVSASTTASFVNVKEAITGWYMRIQGSSTTSAPLLNLANSGLNVANGLGNHIRIYCPQANASTAVMYNPGNYDYDVEVGTSIYINDVLQVS